MTSQPWIGPGDDFDAETAELVRRMGEGVPVLSGEESNIFRTLAINPRLFKRFCVLAGYFFKSKLSPRERELVILRVSHLLGCEYEWSHHERIALAAGLSVEEITLLTVDADPHLDSSVLGQRDRLLVRATSQLIESSQFDDQLKDELKHEMGEDEIIELIMLIGFYRMVATFLQATGVELDVEPGAMWAKGSA